MGKCYFQVIFSYFEKYTLNTPLYLDLYFYYISDATVAWLGYRYSTKGENEVDVCPSEVQVTYTRTLWPKQDLWVLSKSTGSQNPSARLLECVY